jgi:hypothetical protein
MEAGRTNDCVISTHLFDQHARALDSSVEGEKNRHQYPLPRKPAKMCRIIQAFRVPVMRWADNAQAVGH